MVYEQELDLQLDLVESDLYFWGSPDVVFIRREVPIGRCIPDLVCVTFFNLPKSALLPNKWSYRHSYIVWLLRKWRALYPSSIADLSYESVSRIKPIIHDLLKSGTIVEEQTGAIKLADCIYLIKAEVIAIEAKLHKWREALNQAISYKQFADRVIVAMDPSGIPKSAESLLDFKTNQVGLCSVFPGSIDWIIKPALTSPELGHEREFLITSPLVPSRQTLWSRRYAKNASSQA